MVEFVATFIYIIIVFSITSYCLYQYNKLISVNLANNICYNNNINTIKKYYSLADVNIINNEEKIDNQDQISIDLVIDVSCSMDDNLKEYKKFVDNIIAKAHFENGDKIEIISFSDIIEINNTFTSSEKILYNSLDNIEFYGGTALYDSIILALNEVNKREGKKYVVVFTDGDDNSSESNVHEVVDLSNKYDIPIYIIGIGDIENEFSLRYIVSKIKGNYYKSSEIENLYSEIFTK